MALAEVFTALGILEKAFDIARSLKGSKTLQEHLDLLRTKLEFIGADKAQAEEELRQVKEQITQLQEELAVHRNFRDWLGAKWRLLPVGGFDMAVYCGACSKPAHAGGRFYVCSCGWKSLFPAAKASLIKTLRDVSKAYGEPFDEEAFAQRIYEVPEKDDGPRTVRIPTGVRTPQGW